MNGLYVVAAGLLVTIAPTAIDYAKAFMVRKHSCFDGDDVQLIDRLMTLRSDARFKDTDGTTSLNRTINRLTGTEVPSEKPDVV